MLSIPTIGKGALTMDSQQLTPEQFRQFQTIIHSISGISVPDNKIALLTNRIRRRLRARNLTEFDAYLKLLKSPLGTAELDGFLSAITTNETSFFRTQKHFDWLRTEFVDQL